MTEPTPYHPSVQHVLDQFAYEHLPVHLRVISVQLHDVAHKMAAMLSSGPELTVGLRKLLEAKDCLVRQAVIDRHAES